MRWLPIPELSTTLDGLNPASVQALRISRSTKRLDLLATFPNLISLDIENTSIELLDAVSKLVHLRHLTLEPFRLHTIQAVGHLSQLRTLILSSSGWGRTIRIASFAPLRNLTRLESIQTNLVPEDGDLLPLSASPAMQNVLIAPGLYPLNYLAMLAASIRPEYRTGTLSGVVPLYSMADCPKCRAKGTRVILSGYRCGSACTACQQDKLDRHKKRWAELIDEYSPLRRRPGVVAH
ncbi:MAG: hypothetical protein HIU91_02725 [Acidobacteria bacterium]|nr:hypothetical protein [Acidobacteriota bacterium]